MIYRMRAAVLHAPGQISLDTVTDPTLATPRDALVRITASCICGSDLWPYRGLAPRRGRIGHEFVGVVEDIGSEVSSVRRGQVVIAPFVYSCGDCVNCRAGWTTSCVIGGDWGFPDRDGYLADGGQGEFVRIPLADGTLVPARVPEGDDSIPALLALSDADVVPPWPLARICSNAEMLGIDVNRTIALTFFIGSAMAGVAGVMSGLAFNQISNTIGFLAGLKAFTAAVVGGIGSIPGAMIGGLFIGICESFASSYISTQYTDLIVFGILIATMLLRPTGIFGTPALQKV